MDVALTVVPGSGSTGSASRSASGVESPGENAVSLQPQSTASAGGSELPGSVPENEESATAQRETASQNAASSDSNRPVVTSSGSSSSLQNPGTARASCFSDPGLLGSVASIGGISAAGPGSQSAANSCLPSPSPSCLLVLPDKLEPRKSSLRQPVKDGEHAEMKKPAGKLVVLAPDEEQQDDDEWDGNSRRPSLNTAGERSSNPSRFSKGSMCSEKLRMLARGMEPVHVEELWVSEDSESEVVHRGSQRCSLQTNQNEFYNPSKREARRDLAEIRRKLKSWHAQLRPWFVLSCYLTGGPAFIIVGSWFLARAAAAPREHAADYTDRGSVGWFELSVLEDMEPPSYIYFELEDFSQGHRGYARSRDNRQLSRREKPKIRPSEMDVCKPWVSTAGRVNYPCGLVARSIFNDTFAFRLRESGSNEWQRLLVDTSAQAIAEVSGAAEYANLDPEAQQGGASLQVLLHMWILRLFPPVRCDQTDLSLPFRPVEVAEREELTPSGTVVKIPDCHGYMSGSPRCNFTREGVGFACESGYTRVNQDWGVENGHFRVWMSPSGLGTLRKPWARIDRHLAAGSTLNVSFADNFPISKAGGRKLLVISGEEPRNGSRMGSADHLLGAGYVTVGSVCTVAGFYFLVRHMMNLNPLSRVHRVDWKQCVTPGS